MDYDLLFIGMPDKGDGNRFHRGEMGEVRGMEIGSICIWKVSATA
jgi:hypothetical protein